MSGDPQVVAAAFQELLRQAGVAGTAEMRRGRPPTGFGLVATEDLAEQAVVFRIPLGLCIVEPRDLPEEVLRANPGGVPDSFTWDVRLAVKLLEATQGKWTPFWAAYGRVFPQPKQMAQPQLLHRDLLRELQHTAAMVGAQAQQQRLRSLFPELMPAEDAPFTDYPSALQWTFALTRSRAFSAGDDHFALVPFLDLANLSQTPNAEFQFVAAEKVFYMRTTRKVAKGEELCFPVEAWDNQSLFARFGWVEPGGNPFDELPGIAGKEASQRTPASMRLSRKRLWESLRAQSLDPDDLYSLSPYVRATLQSLPLTEEAVSTPLQEISAVVQLRTSLKEVEQSDFKSSVEDDIQLVQHIKAAEVDADPRMLAVLLYRVERKTLLSTAISMLVSYEQWLQRSARALT